MTQLIDQPTAAPTRKLTAVMVWGAFSAIVMFLADVFVPESNDSVSGVLTALEPFVPIIVATVAGYWTREAAE